MIHLDDELIEEYRTDSYEHLSCIEAGLLAMQKDSGHIDAEWAQRALRAAHFLRGGADSFELTTIHQLADGLGAVLALIGSGKMALTAGRARVLLDATDRLHELIGNPAASNQADTADVTSALAGLRADYPGGRPLRVLMAEDDFASRLMMQSFLSRYGECHVAVNGREAVEAFRTAIQNGQRYDLICMDLMMPEMDGREAVRQVRAIEAAGGIPSTAGAKIIMTTAVDELKEVSLCFQELCDGYLVKPIDLGKLLGLMKSYQLAP